MTFTVNKDQSIMAASKTEFSIMWATMCNSCRDVAVAGTGDRTSYVIWSIV